MATIPEHKLIEDAVDLAEEWLQLANEVLTPKEKRFQKQMGSLLAHPGDKVFLTEMIDQCFRAKKSARIGDQVLYLIRRHSRSHGLPGFFSVMDKILIRLFLSVGKYVSGISVPLMVEKIRKDSSQTIIQGERKKLLAYINKQKAMGFKINLNHLGEAVLGEAEALSRLNMYLEDLKKPETEEISVKISTIYSQVNPLAFDHTVDVLKQRLSVLYKTAAGHFYKDRSGITKPKFVNLDMEDHRDLEITATAFRMALEGAELKHCSGGIALQSYIPESFVIQQELTSWAKKRVAEGKKPIKIRIVKGANMQMEQVESAIKNWPLTTYSKKMDTDANFKRMVEFGLRPENINAVSLGIASHNLFELAYAYKLAEKNGISEGYMFEMLTGMADHICRAVGKTVKDLLLYAPHTTRENFINAIAYLVRRLDENSSEENFLRHSFNLRPASPEWHYLKQQFIDAYGHMPTVSHQSYRTQNRLKEMFNNISSTYYSNNFVNEADTDWSIPANRQWAGEVRKKWRKTRGSSPLEIPLVIGGKEEFAHREVGECKDPSLFHDEVMIARYALATKADVENAMNVAQNDPDGWRKKSVLERHRVLSNVAMTIRGMRGDLIGAAAAETGKIFAEADVEVSEAVDFLEYYPYSIQQLGLSENVQHEGKGVGIVVSPWNFPIAIPCGGIAASLAAGNTVIFKPSSDSVLTGWMLCRGYWKAGVSQNTLQFLPCKGSDLGSTLTHHPGADYVIFTGGTETGLEILSQSPNLYLAAETGGKNATIVTAMSDRDEAVKNVIISAFGNGGQKCSATSLLILEKEVYEDKNFKKQLVDATTSFSTGSAWDFENKMGPLIRAPKGDLKQALIQLESGETWALEPLNLKDNPHLWTPGIKWDVAPGSYTHMTEFFGPVLAVMCADNLDHAIELVNQTGYGLTSGLESLDEREHERWKAGIKAGNLYINRSTTGAVTLRQPFGGMGKSALGPGIKAGGPNYVTQFMTYTEKDLPKVPDENMDHPFLKFIQDCLKNLNQENLNREKSDHRKSDLKDPEAYEPDLIKTIHAVKSYLYHAAGEFGQEKDFFYLRGQDNIHRYLPVGKVVIRLHYEDTLFDILARIAAATIAGCSLKVSIPPEFSHSAMQFIESQEMEDIFSKGKIVEETDAALIEMIPKIQRIRYAAPDRVPGSVLQAAAKNGFYIARSEVLMEGRIELLHYYRNQSVCMNYHRYGNLGRRGLAFESPQEA